MKSILIKLTDLFGHDDWSDHESRQDLPIMDRWHTISGCRKRMKSIDFELYEYLDKEFSELTKANPAVIEDIDRKTTSLLLLWKKEFRNHTDEKLKEHREFLQQRLPALGATKDLINSINPSVSMEFEARITEINNFAYTLKHEKPMLYDALFMTVYNNANNNIIKLKGVINWMCDVWTDSNAHVVDAFIKSFIKMNELGETEDPNRKIYWIAETLAHFPVHDFNQHERDVLNKLTKKLCQRLYEKETALKNAPQISYIQSEESKAECRKINRNRRKMLDNDQSEAGSLYQRLLSETPKHIHVYVHNTMAIRCRVFDLFEEKFHGDYVELAKKMNVEVEQAKRWIENVYDLKTLSLLEEAFDTQIVFIPIDPIPESK